jgi:hypothetical protein
MLNKSVLDVEVSCFKNYNTAGNPANINLMTWLTSTKYKDKVDAIRSNPDKQSRDAIKSQLPAITPSGLFSYRSQSNLLSHSGLIQIDLDNLSEGDLDIFKKELQKIKNIAYLAKSVSGRGLWGLIPIPPDPASHKAYFDKLFETFGKDYEITLDDKPKNVASLRGYSYDPEAYFNHSATPFLIKKEPIPKQVTTVSNKEIDSLGLEDSIIKKLEALGDGRRHGGRLNLARYAGGLVAGGSIDASIEDRLIQSYERQYGDVDNSQTQAKEIKAIRDGFENGKLFALYPKEEPESEKVINQLTEVLPIEKLKPEDYISQLHFENGMLMNDMNYPADWDLVGSYTDQKTKDFIQMAIKNPLLIELRKQFDLS